MQRIDQQNYPNHLFLVKTPKNPDMLPSMKELCIAMWFGIGVAYYLKKALFEVLRKYRWEIGTGIFDLYLFLRPIWVVYKMNLNKHKIPT